MHASPHRLAVAAIAGLLALPPLASRTDATQLCQVGRTAQSRVRAEACRKKETLLLDTAALGTSCPADPARRMLSARRDLGGLLVLLGYASPSSLCRTLDADPVACALAFEPSSMGAAACVHVAGKCLTCDLALDAAGVCRNACMPAVTCADPARTLRTRSCRDLTTQPSCTQAWTVTLEFSTTTDVVRGTPCTWDVGAGQCTDCDPERISAGQCANTCIPAAELPVCRQPGRSFGNCHTLSGNAAACVLTFELERYGTQTCWYDDAAAACQGCNPVAESLGLCMNGC